MKKKIIRIVFIVILMLPLIAFAHFLVFPEETRCILIGFAGFNKHKNIYTSGGTGEGKITALLALRSLAEKRNSEFWNNNCSFNYKIIYCSTEKDFNNYGIKGSSAATRLKLGAYVVLREESLDVDIMAHEISHTILYNNIGWYKTNFKIPTWFNEGLAMQVDNRNYYSIDSLLAKKNSGIKLPVITQMKEPGDFFAGDIDTVMLNFATAKYVVYEWLKTHSLSGFIEAIRAGRSFENAYGLK